MRILLTCASAMALVIGVPALSQGQGNGQGGGPKAERGNGGGPGNARGNRGGGQADRGNRGGNQRADRGGPPDRGQGEGRGNPQAGRGNAGGNQQADRGNRGGPPADRGNGNRGEGQARGASGNAGPPASRGNGANARTDRDRRGPSRARGNAVLERFAGNDFYRERRFADRDYRDRIIGISDRVYRGQSCPPGLSTKNAFCMPPGQYRKRFDVGSRFTLGGARLPDWYRSAGLSSLLFGRDLGRFDYRYADGYAYRLDPETRLVLAALPLLGGALGIGQILPDSLTSYNVPTAYRPVYYDDRYNYRYGANAIYRVDPATDAILGVSELLTGDFRVGEPVPAGYSVYNVPYDYRDRYYDTAQYTYRYNNGRIYRIDPETRLVLAAIDVLT